MDILPVMHILLLQSSHINIYNYCDIIYGYRFSLGQACSAGSPLNSVSIIIASPLIVEKYYHIQYQMVIHCIMFEAHDEFQ